MSILLPLPVSCGSGEATERRNKAEERSPAPTVEEGKKYKLRLQAISSIFPRITAQFILCRTESFSKSSVKLMFACHSFDFRFVFFALFLCCFPLNRLQKNSFSLVRGLFVAAVFPWSATHRSEFRICVRRATGVRKRAKINVS